ncbi:MAG: hypothetical protein KGI54_17605 [Pseudomonadota bacterium]|nr:hypothetical protein [Pseudomonadota bacterium]
MKKLTFIDKLKITKNMFFPGVDGFKSTATGGGMTSTNIQASIVNDAKRLDKFQAPIQLQRIKVDLQYWRDAIKEAERPLPALPYRVMMQQIFQDTINNGHVSACIEKRQSLVLLKEYHICNDDGTTDEEATALINTAWFRLAMKYMLDAKAFGYSLISFGDMVNGDFPEIRTIRRWNISPDRLIYAPFQYVPAGIRFLDPEAKDPNGNKYVDWSMYIETANELGVSRCGYGYLYKVAPYEIVLRNLLGWNTDYIEMFGSPLRVGKTNKAGDERDAFEQMLAQAAFAGYALLDNIQGEEIEFVEQKGGTGADGSAYSSLEQRCMDIISKIILGHPKAIDEPPGRLGAGKSKGSSGIGQSPAQIALDEKESHDSRDLAVWLNDIYIPKLINLGLNLPLGKKFAFKDDLEQEQIRRNENQNNLEDAQVMLTIKQAGGSPDWKFFSERTGIQTEAAPEPPVNPSFSKEIQNKLKSIYK